MDLKAASKEQALSANNMAEEQQEMESLKVMISELNAQRESDLLKIQVNLIKYTQFYDRYRNLKNKSLSLRVLS